MEKQKKNPVKKEKFALYIENEKLDLARMYYEADNCASISEYIGKAVEFYSGYVSNEHNQNYMPKIVISTLKSIIQMSESRQCSQLYRVAVELSLLSNLIAAENHFSPEDVGALRESCETEVKKINGVLRLEEAARWQT